MCHRWRCADGRLLQHTAFSRWHLIFRPSTAVDRRHRFGRSYNWSIRQPVNAGSNPGRCRGASRCQSSALDSLPLRAAPSTRRLGSTITNQCTGPGRRVNFLQFRCQPGAGPAGDRRYVIPRRKGVCSPSVWSRLRCRRLLEGLSMAGVRYLPPGCGPRSKWASGERIGLQLFSQRCGL